jgi:hypothetical protein
VEVGSALEGRREEAAEREGWDARRVEISTLEPGRFCQPLFTKIRLDEMAQTYHS